ncbi:MAG: methylenetetrahydrofolate reductase [Candidatus Neomarinimicrobiota bacterium]
MKVTECIEQANSTLFSYEIIPPLRGGTAQRIFDLVEQLVPFDPPFIDMTSRAAEVYHEKLPDGATRRHIRRKRPGTIGLTAAIKNRYDLETVPHILCHGFTREETEDALIELNYLGINNVMALTGDQTERMSPGNEKSTINRYASELVEQIVNMNQGIYLEALEDTHPTDFCIGVGGYPELHSESSDWEANIRFVKNKVDAGAHYIVSQMFFGNSDFFRLVKDCRKAGIRVPIIPGLKVLTTKRHLTLLPELFNVEVPEPLASRAREADPTEVKRIGIEWALEQCQGLIEASVPCIHFYIMQDASTVAKIVSQLI